MGSTALRRADRSAWFASPDGSAVARRGNLNSALRNSRSVQGFTYIGLLILVAIISVAATATIQLGAVLQRREAERELLYVGEQFQLALFSYTQRTPAGAPRLPRELSDLLKDPRLSVQVRHLRRVPPDPITGKLEWGLLRTPDGYITGVHSLSEAAPIKVANFESPFAHFADASRYSDWVFGMQNTRQAETSAPASQSKDR
jgi:type II secretory pathway pseudopilin PulG